MIVRIPERSVALTGRFCAMSHEEPRKWQQRRRAGRNWPTSFFSRSRNPRPRIGRNWLNACHRYLTGHPGEVSFSVGTLADLSRDVNDRDFDVALHIVFENRAAHDAYQTAPRHLKFIDENKADWKKVRVFDSILSKA